MAKKLVSVIVGGAGGRMGRTILKLAHEDPSIRIGGAFERADHEVVGRDIGDLIGSKPLHISVHPDLRECIDRGTVVIDFTHALATEQHLEIAYEAKRAMVIGTTGLSKAFVNRLQAVSHKIPVVQAPNMSVGVNLLFQLVASVAKALDTRYDAEIVEEHHRDKKDAPSGTALELARLIAEARKIKLDPNVVYGRHGVSEPRRKGIIGIHAVRGGDTVGSHTVSFMSDGERIDLTHRASSREAFGYGALYAAKFIAKRRNGLYNIREELGL